MNNDDKKTIIVFISLIIMICLVWAYNINNNKSYKFDRKIKYIFGSLTYDNVYNKGKDLFINGIKLLDSDFIFELDNKDNIEYYSLGKKNNYRKIVNYSLLFSTLSSKARDKYIKDRDIVQNSNDYYMGNYIKEVKKNYIGSSLDIESYDKDKVVFSSVNYFCDNYEYIGIIVDNVECSYTETKTTWTMIMENNILKIDNLEDFRRIMQ